MRKPVHEYTDEQIQKRLDFAEMIRAQCRQHHKDDTLPKHLVEEEAELLAEQSKRAALVNGGGI